MELHLTATGCHLPYGITQCYLTPDTSEHTTHANWRGFAPFECFPVVIVVYYINRPTVQFNLVFILVM